MNEIESEVLGESKRRARGRRSASSVCDESKPVSTDVELNYCYFKFFSGRTTHSCSSTTQERKKASASPAPIPVPRWATTIGFVSRGSLSLHKDMQAWVCVHSLLFVFKRYFQPHFYYPMYLHMDSVPVRKWLPFFHSCIIFHGTNVPHGRTFELPPSLLRFGQNPLCTVNPSATNRPRFVLLFPWPWSGTM